MESFILRVLALQSELKAPKGQTNKFGGYKYRSCEDILEAVKPLLKKYGLVLTVGDDLMNVGDRYYICATATLRDTDAKQPLKTAHTLVKRLRRREWMRLRLPEPHPAMLENTL